MKNLSLKYSILLAAVSGIITAFAFPTMFSGLMLPNLGFLAWFSLVPLFVAVDHAGVRRAFILVFIAGLIYYSISLYWLYNALTEYGGLSPLVSITILSLMMVILSIYLALAPSWVSWFRSRCGGSAIYLLPIAWVAVELARNYFPAGGFPWNNIAYSQSGYPILIQIADMTGVYGVTFLIIMVNQLFAGLIAKGSGLDIRQVETNLVVVAVIFAIVLAYGWYRLETSPVRSPAVRMVRAALIQGNIPQDEKWDVDLMEENLGVYKKYMQWIKDSAVDLAIWPESAYPYVVPLEAIGFKPEKLGVNPKKEDSPWLLMGALSIDRDRPDRALYNSVILADNGGMIIDRYHKKHLVPFGEYVPYRKALFFVKKLVEPLGDFMAGKGYTPLLVRDNFMVGPLVCYEDVFPEISREQVRNGANLLVNMTNDAWYGYSSAAHQHLAISVFRAVENRRYMLRATNTGVTAVIDPRGKVELESDLFVPTFVVAGVPVLDGLTIYDRIGDLFAYICAAIVVLLSIVVVIRKYLPLPRGRGSR